MRLIRIAVILLLGIVLVSAVACGAKTYYLNVAVIGEGFVDPSSGTYKEGAVVELFADCDADWELSHWSGDASGTNSVISITMNSNKTIEAVFVKRQPAPTPIPTPTSAPTATVAITTHRSSEEVINLVKAHVAYVRMQYDYTCNGVPVTFTDYRATCLSGGWLVSASSKYSACTFSWYVDDYSGIIQYTGGNYQ